MIVSSYRTEPVAFAPAPAPPPPPPPPSGPGLLLTSPDLFFADSFAGATVRLNWEAPQAMADGSAINTAPVTGYEWYISTATGGAYSGSPSVVQSGTTGSSVLSTTVVGLPTTGTLYAAVRAINSNGASGYAFEIQWPAT